MSSHSNFGEEKEAESSRLQDARVMLKWISFAKPKCVLGFEKLPTTSLPTMSTKNHGISVCLDSIEGWNPPVQLQDDSGKFEILVQLSLSLLHLQSSTFFGSTWMSSPIPITDDNIEFSEIIYTITRIVDPSCVGIIEIVASRYDIDKQLVTAQYGLDFTHI